METFAFTPIGVMRTGLRERAEAARQPYVAADAPGTIELFPGHRYEDALADLDAWTHLWVIFVFHLNRSWRPKVQPPRGRGERRGVFATRSPHRPNPLGMSVLKLLRVEGLSVHVAGVDLVDGTPVLDLKPYVPFADAISDAGTGWIGRDPDPPWQVAWTDLAVQQRAWLAQRGLELGPAIERALTLGPLPHAYRRIRQTPAGPELAVKDWRALFAVHDRTLTVTRIRSGYRTAQVLTDPAIALHRAFAESFP